MDKYIKFTEEVCGEIDFYDFTCRGDCPYIKGAGEMCTRCCFFCPKNERKYKKCKYRCNMAKEWDYYIHRSNFKAEF